MIEQTAGEKARDFFITTQEALTEDTVFTAPIWHRCGTSGNRVALFREFSEQDDQATEALSNPPTRQLLFGFS